MAGGSLAVDLDVLVVEGGHGPVALPGGVVVEMVAVGDNLRHAGSAAVLDLRGSLVPVVGLPALMGAAHDEGATDVVVVIRHGEGLVGLRVASLHGTETVACAPLPAQAAAPGYAGAVARDGGVMLVLDTDGLLRGAGIDDGARETVAVAEAADTLQALLCRAGPGTLRAIPVSAVRRVEGEAKVEALTGRHVMRLGTGLIEVVPLPGVTVAQGLPVVLVGDGPDGTALVVEEVLDIVDLREVDGAPEPGAGSLGAWMAGERVVDVVDVSAYLRPQEGHGRPAQGAAPSPVAAAVAQAA